MAGLMDFLFGSGDKLKKVDQYDPNQKKLMEMMSRLLVGGKGQQGGLNQAFGLLQSYLDPESDVYKNFEAPYMQQFQDQIVPMLAERFAGAGGGMGGGISSSGFGQALGAAGSQLQTNLAQMKSGMQRDSINDIMGLSNTLMGLQPFGYERRQGSPGLVPGAFGSFMGQYFR